MPRVKTKTLIALFTISFASFALFSFWDVRRHKLSYIRNSNSVYDNGSLTVTSKDKLHNSNVFSTSKFKSNDERLSSEIDVNNNNLYTATTSFSSSNLNTHKLRTQLSHQHANLSSLLHLFMANKQNPWFMSDGTLRPDDNGVDYPFHSLPIWPHESDDDRIINQLMYMPHNYVQSKEQKLKKILLYFGRGGWNARDLPMGQTKFLRDKCPVNSCELSIDPNDAATADVIFFKVSFNIDN